MAVGAARAPEAQGREEEGDLLSNQAPGSPTQLLSAHSVGSDPPHPGDEDRAKGLFLILVAPALPAPTPPPTHPLVWALTVCPSAQRMSAYLSSKT